MTIEEERPQLPQLPLVRQFIRPRHVLPRFNPEIIKRNEIINDYEIALIEHFLAPLKKQIGKPGLLLRFIWRNFKKKIMDAGPNYKKLAEKCMKNLELRKRIAVIKANRETDSDRKAIVFVQYAMRILDVFDYILPTSIRKYQFMDVKKQHLFIHLAHRELVIQNEEDAVLRHYLINELNYKVVPVGINFVSPAHSSISDSESVRMIRNLDRVENESFYPDDESSNGSFYSIHDDYSASEDNEESDITS